MQMALLSGDIHWRGASGTQGRYRFRSALIGSLLFHCSLAGLATAVALQKPEIREPVMIDLTAAPLPEPESQQQTVKKTAGSRMRKRLPAKTAQMSPPPQTSAPVPAASAAAVPQQAPSGAETGHLNTASGEGTASGTGTAAAGTGQKGSGQAATDTKETLQKRYLREHFTYIRDLIGKELRYPRQAIRMGWHGRVIVTFLVLVDGTVADLRINHGSGVPLLDRNALETVERAAPFPKPPVSARLVIPVDYILE